VRWADQAQEAGVKIAEPLEIPKTSEPLLHRRNCDDAVMQDVENDEEDDEFWDACET
jgi:hypothetical protein